MRIEQWPYIVRMRLRTLFGRTQVEQELDDELRYHVERQIEENIASGMSPDEARRAAMRALGRIERRKDECRDAWGISLLDNLVRDTRQALRALRRDIGFTVGVLALLSLGIGANAAVFSIVDGILLEPLPYPEPERLFVIRELTPERGSATRSVNGLHFHEWRRACGCFEGVALAEYNQQMNLSAGGEPERVPTVRVTPNAFSVLGVSAQLGRTFVPGDEEAGESPPIVISDGLWRRRFGASPDVIGRSIELDGIPSVIVGVLPKGFEHHWGREDSRVDVYRPWDAAPQEWWGWTNNYSYSAVARLEDGMSADEALERLNAVQAAIAALHFRNTEWRTVSLEAVLIPLHEWVTGESRDGLLMLLAGVAAALLVACMNIANLMLARATERTREAGVRGALGASRIAIFRGALIESGILAAAGAALGVVVAFVGLRLFTSIAGGGLPRAAAVELDGSVLAAVVALAIGSTFAFGLLPALQMTRGRRRAPSLLRGLARAARRGTARRRGGRHERLAVVRHELGLHGAPARRVSACGGTPADRVPLRVAGVSRGDGHPDPCGALARAARVSRSCRCHLRAHRDAGLGRASAARPTLSYGEPGRSDVRGRRHRARCPVGGSRRRTGAHRVRTACRDAQHRLPGRFDLRAYGGRPFSGSGSPSRNGPLARSGPRARAAAHDVRGRSIYARRAALPARARRRVRRRIAADRGARHVCRLVVRRR